MERGAFDRGPGNARRPGGLKKQWELQERIVVVKGFDGNLHPWEVLEFMKLGGQVTAITVIRGILENAFGTGRHQWAGRSIAYAEYSEIKMLDEAVPTHSERSALSLHGKRHLNRCVEVYRSNKDSQGRWDQDEDDGFNSWRTLVHVYHPDPVTGLRQKEWRTTWINPHRRQLLKAQGYVRQSYKARSSSRPKDYTTVEDEENAWASTRSRSPRSSWQDWEEPWETDSTHPQATEE